MSRCDHVEIINLTFTSLDGVLPVVFLRSFVLISSATNRAKFHLYNYVIAGCMFLGCMPSIRIRLSRLLTVSEDELSSFSLFGCASP